MDPNQSDEERNNFSEVDDETDVWFMIQAYEYNQRLQAEQTLPLFTHNLIYREHDDAKTRLLRDYFIEACEHIAHDCLDKFNKCIIDLFMPKYLRKPTVADIQNVYARHEYVHGFSEMIESIDSGANNDINILDNSPLFDDLFDDIAPIVLFEVNRVRNVQLRLLKLSLESLEDTNLSQEDDHHSFGIFLIEEDLLVYAYEIKLQGLLVASSNGTNMFMANLSSTDPVTDEARPSYDSDILSEYVKDNEVPVVHSDVSSISNDAFMMIYIDMCEPHA
nr:reverse transcriptase domain-containing protein [Tanacetum cinerariifolium]